MRMLIFYALASSQVRALTLRARSEPFSSTNTELTEIPDLSAQERESVHPRADPCIEHSCGSPSSANGQSARRRLVYQPEVDRISDRDISSPTRPTTSPARSTSITLSEQDTIQQQLREEIREADVHMEHARRIIEDQYEQRETDFRATQTELDEIDTLFREISQTRPAELSKRIRHFFHARKDADGKALPQVGLDKFVWTDRDIRAVREFFSSCLDENELSAIPMSNGEVCCICVEQEVHDDRQRSENALRDAVIQAPCGHRFCSSCVYPVEINLKKKSLK